jgi:hypothetical protein
VRAPAEPTLVLQGFLAALGVPGPQAGLDTLASLYRSLLAGRRMLVVLDNAASSAQVEPLLPAAPGCAVLVTSRGHLPTARAYPITIHPLVPAEAAAMLTARLAPGRTTAEPAALAEIVEHCAGLPVALTVLAARAAVRPDFPLAAFVRELRDPVDRLDVLDGGEPETRVREVFGCSYRQLGRPAARLFRLLALHPGPEVSVRAAAGLAGLPFEQTRSLLRELAQAHLVAESAPEGYVLSGLLRAYAAELVERAESSAERAAARDRLRPLREPPRRAQADTGPRAAATG